MRRSIIDTREKLSNNNQNKMNNKEQIVAKPISDLHALETQSSSSVETSPSPLLFSIPLNTTQIAVTSPKIFCDSALEKDSIDSAEIAEDIIHSLGVYVHILTMSINDSPKSIRNCMM